MYMWLAFVDIFSLAYYKKSFSLSCLALFMVKPPQNWCVKSVTLFSWSNFYQASSSWLGGWGGIRVGGTMHMHYYAKLNKWLNWSTVVWHAFSLQERTSLKARRVLLAIQVIGVLGFNYYSMMSYWYCQPYGILYHSEEWLRQYYDC